MKTIKDIKLELKKHQVVIKPLLTTVGSDVYSLFNKKKSPKILKGGKTALVPKYSETGALNSIFMIRQMVPITRDRLDQVVSLVSEYSADYKKTIEKPEFDGNEGA